MVVRLDVALNILPSDIQKYCACMDQVKARLALATSIMNAPPPAGDHSAQAELIAIQFRKILELIAFGSLVANQVKFSTAYADFATHWKVKGLLANLKIINADFYPTPLKPMVLQSDGVKHFPKVLSGFLNLNQFSNLYDDCNSVLHTSNPFNIKRKAKSISKEAAAKWIKHIKVLLNIHLARLVDA